MLEKLSKDVKHPNEIVVYNALIELAGKDYVVRNHTLQSLCSYFCMEHSSTNQSLIKYRLDSLARKGYIEIIEDPTIYNQRFFKLLTTTERKDKSVEIETTTVTKEEKKQYESLMMEVLEKAKKYDYIKNRVKELVTNLADEIDKL